MKLRSSYARNGPSCARRRQVSASQISPRRQCVGPASVYAEAVEFFGTLPLRNNPPRPGSPSSMQSKAPSCQLQSDQNEPDLWERFPSCAKAVFSRHLTSLRLPTIGAYDLHCTIICISLQSVTCHPVAATIAHWSITKIARSITPGRRLPNHCKIPAHPGRSVKAGSSSGGHQFRCPLCRAPTKSSSTDLSRSPQVHPG
jgi:hypothetical protein